MAESRGSVAGLAKQGLIRSGAYSLMNDRVESAENRLDGLVLRVNLN